MGRVILTSHFDRLFVNCANGLLQYDALGNVYLVANGKLYCTGTGGVYIDSGGNYVHIDSTGVNIKGISTTIDGANLIVKSDDVILEEGHITASCPNFLDECYIIAQPLGPGEVGIPEHDFSGLRLWKGSNHYCASLVSYDGNTQAYISSLGLFDTGELLLTNNLKNSYFYIDSVGDIFIESGTGVNDGMQIIAHSRGAIALQSDYGQINLKRDTNNYVKFVEDTAQELITAYLRNGENDYDKYINQDNDYRKVVTEYRGTAPDSTKWNGKAFPNDAHGLLHNDGAGNIVWDTNTYLKTADQPSSNAVWGTFGTYTDNIVAGATLTKTINIGSGFTNGEAFFTIPSGSNGDGLHVWFDTDSSHTFGIENEHGTAYSTFRGRHAWLSVSSTYGPASTALANSIRVQDVYINGSNLTIIYKNTHASTTVALNSLGNYKVWKN
jgi:hypothetical protein